MPSAGRFIGARAVAVSFVLALVALGLLLWAAPADAQTPVTASVSDVDDSEDPVRAVLTVDQGGRPVADLEVGSVDVTDGGSVVPVTRLEPVVDDSVPLALVLVVDTSGSMSDQLGVVQAAATDLVERIGPTDEAALVAFSSEVTTIEPLSADRAVLTAAIAGLEAVGDTALYDAVSVAAEVARDSGFQRRAVVLLTDGEDFGGVSARDRADSIADSEGAAAFYTIGVGPSVDADYLGGLADATGGRFFPATSGSEITEVYSTIESLLRSQYLLEFARGDAVGGDERSLTVAVDVDGLLAVASASYVSAAPAAPPPPPPVGTTQAPEAPAAPPIQAPIEEVAPADGGGSLVGQPVLLLALAALLALGGVWLLRRRGDETASAPTVGAIRLDRRPIARTPDERPARVSGRLTLAGADGPLTVDVEGIPITIGSDDGSALQLERAPGVAPEHARVWTRDGRVMVHHLAPGFDTRLNGQSIEWAVLSDGDQLTVGPYEIAYAVGAGVPAMASSGGQ